MIRTRVGLSALTGAMVVCLAATTAGPASARWTSHDGSRVGTELNGPPGGNWWETCADKLVGRTGWAVPVMNGQDPASIPIPEDAYTGVEYEVLKSIPGAPSQQIATFTTPARVRLPAPILISGSGEFVYTAAPFAVRLNNVQPGDELRIKPFPDVIGPTTIFLTAVDCGDSGFLYEWEGDPGLCTSTGGRFMVVDVNGDHRADVVCQSPRTGVLKVGLARSDGQFVQTDWQGTVGACGSKARLLMGDVNGDDRTDLVCHTRKTGATSVALARTAGRFTRVHWRGTVAFCRTARTRLLVGDVSGDHRADLVCQNPTTRAVQVALARAGGRFSQVDWHGAMSFCRAPGTSLQLGKVNGDARADLVCQDPATGRVAVALARGPGRFPKVDTRSTPGLCTTAGTQLRLGDVTGDGRADLVCHDTASGHVWLALARSGARYVAMDWDRNLGFCPGSPGWLQVADVNGDGRADLFCHDPATGHMHAAYSDL